MLTGRLMGMPGEWRTCLRQLHQLPVPMLGYLPLWLETLRAGLGADGVAALWSHASADVDVHAGPGETCWYAPQAPMSACEQLVASGWAMPPVEDLQRTLARGDIACAHARRSRCSGRAASVSLRRPPELERCFPDGDLLDVCLLPAGRGVASAHDADGPGTESAKAPVAALRLLVSRHRARPRFSAREVSAFEDAAAEFTTAPGRPCFPAPAAAGTPIPALCPDDPPANGNDVAGMLVWRGRQPEWADPVALTLMRRVWRLAPGVAWPDACVVVQACQALVDELAFRVAGGASSDAQAHAAVQVPGGTLHLHATRLCGMGGNATDRVRIALHLAVPPAIRLLQRLWTTALTPVQREIAMRLLAGQSRVETREACAIGVQTLKTHLALMRARLDPVRDAALLAGLRGAGAAAM
ncbi:helix-turn-helix transcriptional regulator [Pandoraea pulmonicola]|uniref:helix-turn-helix transcriptional regulator n=1 Tax=Pandoraea pulmonicola TaxID=93221 RepID=UPI0011C07D94|nr:hypothetical protein [Pandoraea pulmonicola]